MPPLPSPNQVFIQYAGWYRGSQGSSRSMQLNSVRNDLIKVLKYLRCKPAFVHNQFMNSILSMRSILDRHNDKTTMWHLLTDFDLVYTDEAGYVKLLPTTNPTRNAIVGLSFYACMLLVDSLFAAQRPDGSWQDWGLGAGVLYDTRFLARHVT